MDFFTWPGSPRNPGIDFSLAGKAMLLWPWLPQKPGLDRACHTFPGPAFLASPAKNLASLATPAFAGLSGLLTALLMQGQEVWQLLVSQTNLYAEQKRGPAESSVWCPVTESEMKAWIGLYLNIGLVTKPILNLYWSTDPVVSSPFFTSLILWTRFFQILQHLHFADNTCATHLTPETTIRKPLACGTGWSHRVALPREICGVKKGEFIQVKAKFDLHDMA